MHFQSGLFTQAGKKTKNNFLFSRLNYLLKLSPELLFSTSRECISSKCKCWYLVNNIKRNPFNFIKIWSREHSLVTRHRFHLHVIFVSPDSAWELQDVLGQENQSKTANAVSSSTWAGRSKKTQTKTEGVEELRVHYLPSFLVG